MKPDASDFLSNTRVQHIQRQLVVLVDAQGVIQTVNGRWNPFETPDVRDLPPLEPGGSCFSIFSTSHALSAESTQRLSDALRAVLQQPSTCSRFETRLTGSHGGHWLEATFAPLSLNSSPGALITFIDITVRKQSELALAESEQRFRAMVDHEPECVKIVDLNGNLQEMNPAGLKIIEAESLDQVVRGQVANLVHADDRKSFLRLHHQVCSGEVGHLKYRIIGLKGGLRWVETHSVPLRDTNGSVTSVLSVTQDITERKLAEEALKTSETRFHRAFARASVGFAITGMDGVILHINDHYCHITGYTENEMVGSTFERITHPDDIARKNELNQRLIAGEISDFNVEKRYLRKSGDIAWVENSVSVIRDDSGVPLNRLVLCKDITEAHHNQQQLRLLETSVANLNDIVLITEAEPVDEPGPRIVFVNDAFVKHTGYTRDEVIGRSPRFLQGPDSDRATLDRIRAAIKAGRPIKEELINYKKDGTPCCLEIDIVPISGPAEKPAHFVAIQRDITARKEAEDRLRRTNLQYEKQRAALARLMRGGVMQAVHLEDAFREMTEMIAHTTAVERVSIWRFNQERSSIVCQELFEASANRHSSGLELLGRDYPTYFRALEKDEMISANDAHIDPRTQEFTAGYLEPQGITAMLDAPIHVNGVIAGVLCQEHVGPSRKWMPEEESFAVSLANLISLALAQWHRRQIEDQLRQQASLLDKANDAILVRDLDHTITYWNKSAEKLYGWTAEEAVGHKVSELLHNDDVQLLEMNALALANGEWNGEIQQRNKAGEELFVEGRWTLVRDATGQPKCILAINTDITQKKRLEDQVLRTQRMESIGTLAGGIAHDLNNVLTPILMSVDLLKLRIPEPACQQTLDTIAASARRGADMLRQVLSFARGVEGQKKQMQISSLLRDLARIVRDTFPKNIDLRMPELPENWGIIGDPTQIHQVLLNLCVNARDAMPAGGTLSISAESVMLDAQYTAMNIEAREGPYIMISVTDEGEGIAREILPKIFDPFFTTKIPGQGTGLGLSTSLAIVKSHGGFIRVYSDPGHGCRFSVYLPALLEPVLEQSNAEDTPLPLGNQELVLLVDDEASVRDITRQTLEAFGYRVLLAADGTEAVTLYAKHQREIAVVLTDMMMPVMDGSATIQVLMKMNPKIRIIAASGIPANGSIAKAAGAGVKQFLPKPYTAETILRSLQHVLREP